MPCTRTRCSSHRWSATTRHPATRARRRALLAPSDRGELLLVRGNLRTMHWPELRKLLRNSLLLPGHGHGVAGGRVAEGDARCPARRPDHGRPRRWQPRLRGGLPQHAQGLDVVGAVRRAGSGVGPIPDACRPGTSSRSPPGRLRPGPNRSRRAPTRSRWATSCGRAPMTAGWCRTRSLPCAPRSRWAPTIR